jgi:cell division protein FtsI (penicillin-binding protein 3)
MQSRKRLTFIAFFIFALFSLLIAKFYKIQILEGQKWTKKANNQHYFVINEPFSRGRFFSNTSLNRRHPEKPQSFVIDVKKFHLHIDPASIPAKDHDAIANHLIANLNLSIDEKIECRHQFDYKSRNRKIAMWLDKETKDEIMEWWGPFARERSIPRNALFFLSDYQRSYPFGKLLGQVLHTIQNKKDEKTGQGIPTGGLEAQFDSFLKGTPGKRRLMRSPRNSFEMGEVISMPENGADVYLTINHNLQEIAEDELAKGVKQSHAKSGFAVMMDPKTGAILALAQYPFFNPPDYQRYFNDAELIQHTRIRAITDANEPGSIMKPMTLAIALVSNEILKKRGEKELFNPDEKMATSDSHFPGRSKPLKDTHLHYFLNMDMALQKSSNIYMARLNEKIIDRLGKDFYRSCLVNIFGFGKKTGIELQSESAGVLPRIGKQHSNGTLEWSASTPYSMAIGHNLQLSSMQLVAAYGVFANGGYLVKPTLIQKIVKTHVDGTKEILVDNQTPEKLKSFPQVLKKDIVKRVVKAMKYVTKRGGSAPLADVRGYTEVGKTGTAEKVINGTYSKTHYCSSFVGFTPVNHPAFVLVVTIDEPECLYIPGSGSQHHGGKCAAPVFREISRRSLEFLGIAPDDPHGYPTADPRYDPKKADWILETEVLKEMYEKWNKQ